MTDYDREYIKKLSRALGFLLFGIVAAALVASMMVTSGCVTMARDIIMPTPEPTPIPTTTAPPTPTPDLTPIQYITVTEEPERYMVRTNGRHLREWLHWYREDVQGINGEGTKDLSTWFTVYGYRFEWLYHYHSVMHGSAAFPIRRPDPGYKFLFVFMNMYSDMTVGDDVRQWGYEPEHFAVQIEDSIYLPDTDIEPGWRIKELDKVWDYAHVTSPGPWGYRIVQEPGSGIIKAEELGWIYGGRSNAWDGYLVFQVPHTTTADQVKVLANFDNLGGRVWWSLV